VEAERLSSEALTEAVREILATPSTAQHPSVDHIEETTSTSTEQQVEKPSEEHKTIASSPITTTTTEEQVIVRPAYVKQDELPESREISSVTETVQETTSEGHRPSTEDATKNVEAERLSSEALTEAVREILATPPTAQLPSVDHTDETTSTSTEQQVDKPSEEHKTIASIPITTTTTEEQVIVRPAYVKQDELPESRGISSVTETVQDITSEERRPSTEDTTKEVEAERLSSEALTEAVREILATPSTVHLPAVDVHSETTQSIDQLSKDSVVQTAPPTSITSAEPRMVEEEIIKTQPPSSEIVEQTEVREEVSTDSLTETVRQILAAPVPARLPIVDHPTAKTTVQFEEDTVKPFADSLNQSIELTTTTIASPILLTTKEAEAERLSSVALTEAVREILHTPLAVHPSSAGTEEQVKMPFVDTTTETTEENKTIVTSPVTTTKEDTMPEPSKTSSVIETVEGTAFEEHKPSIQDTTNEAEAERVSSEALTEAVREILATPLTVHLPTVDHTIEVTTAPTDKQLEKPSVDTVVHTTEQDKPIIISEVTRTEEKVVPTTGTDAELLEIPNQSSSVIEAVEGTTFEERQLSTDDTTKEVAAEQLSSQALTDAVREILATPLAVHLPSVDITSETTESTVRQSEQTLPTTASKAETQINIIPSHPTTVEKTTEEERSTETEKLVLQPTRTVITTVQETTTEDEPSSNAVKETKEVHDDVSIDSLAETVRQILTTPALAHLPSVEHTRSSTTLTEKEVEQPSTGVLGNMVQPIKNVYNELITTSEESTAPDISTKETDVKKR
jgi:hypothetical protein